MESISIKRYTWKQLPKITILPVTNNYQYTKNIPGNNSHESAILIKSKPLNILWLFNNFDMIYKKNICNLFIHKKKKNLKENNK